MIYKMNKPSENMLKSNSEIFQLMRESAEREELELQEKIKRESSIEKMQLKEAESRYIEYAKRQSNIGVAETRSLDRIRTALLSECMFKLYKESCGFPLANTDAVVAKNLINTFIKEQGVYNLLSNFKTKNLLLSEFARLTYKYSVLESCSDCEAKEFIINPTAKDDFFKELENVDTEDASKLIKARVSDAIADFVDTNVNNKLDFEEVIQAAQDRIAKTDDENIIEQYSNQAKRKINEMKMRNGKNVFCCLVESISKQAFKDDALKKKYINEASLNIESVVNDAQLIYTMLEMVNTTNMVNEKFTRDYINSLV